MPEVARLTCHRCCAYYPNVSILKCHSDLLGVLYLCRTCHKRFHPTCTRYESAVRSEDKLCDKCLTRDATVVCPQCAGRYSEVQLCDVCSQLTHTDDYSVHLDHVRAVPV